MITCPGRDFTSSIKFPFVIDDIVLYLGTSHLFQNKTHGLYVLSHVECNHLRTADSFPNLTKSSEL